MIASLVMLSSYSQGIYRSTASDISFFAGTAIEDINAVSEKAVSFLNIETGEVVVSIPIRSFHFDQSLMEEHFNENYIESEKYPKAEFKGTIRNSSSLNWKSSTTMTIVVDGTLSLHGVSRTRTFELHATGTDRKILVTSDFIVPLADHNIDRPKLLWEKLTDQVEVKVKITYEQYQAPHH